VNEVKLMGIFICEIEDILAIESNTESNYNFQMIENPS
jgi:hypothetical protein